MKLTPEEVAQAVTETSQFMDRRAQEGGDLVRETVQRITEAALREASRILADKFEGKVRFGEFPRDTFLELCGYPAAPLQKAFDPGCVSCAGTGIPGFGVGDVFGQADTCDCRYEPEHEAFPKCNCHVPDDPRPCPYPHDGPKLCDCFKCRMGRGAIGQIDEGSAYSEGEV